METLKLFENAEFGQIRTIEIEGKPYFAASDVAKALSYSNPRKAILDHCKGVTKRDTPTNGGLQKISLIPEGDIYRLIVRSKLPSAEKFERWIFDEVLPSIRERGVYATAETAERLLNDPDFMIKAFTALKDAKEANTVLENRIEQLKPKEIFADAVSVSTNSILIGDLAKLISQNGVNIGQNRLFKWLRENSYLIGREGDSYNMPAQKAMNLKLLEIEERAFKNTWGNVMTARTVKVTGKGQLYFINKIIKETKKAG